MYVRMMILKCEPCDDGLRIMERDRSERIDINVRQHGVGLPPTYLPTIESIFRDRHLGSSHSIIISQRTIQAEI